MSTRKTNNLEEQNSLEDDKELVCNQNDIEALAAKQSGIHKGTVKIAFNAVWDAIRYKLEQGYEVKLHGKGDFYLSKRPTRVGRSPLTGEEYDIPEREAMAFRTSPAYAKRLRERRKALKEEQAKQNDE